MGKSEKQIEWEADKKAQRKRSDERQAIKAKLKEKPGKIEEGGSVKETSTVQSDEITFIESFAPGSGNVRALAEDDNFDLDCGDEFYSQSDSELGSESHATIPVEPFSTIVSKRVFYRSIGAFNPN